MCKRRNKLSAKSPAGGAKTPQKAFKHLEIMTLPSIKRVVNIVETEGKFWRFLAKRAVGMKFWHECNNQCINISRVWQ